MARIKKKGTSGAARNYLTRSQAVRKLQISLGDFRRLCIFKGIYPREPRSKKRVTPSSTPSTTFYYAKDIQYLLHEPLLAKFRDQKALAKKIAKALGRNEVSDAARWERDLAPRLRLDHIIKERYPTFVDALRDLDDALSLLNLFAHLPATTEVPAKTIAKCQRLTLEFEHFIIRTHALRKSFLSIKGIYYEATIQGQDILWLVPYKFVQRTSGDVDFRIMATFVEFYASLLGFVNFRLYNSIGLIYPPRFDTASGEQGAELGAFQLQGKEDGQIEQIEDVADIESNERAQQEADRLITVPDEQKQSMAANDITQDTASVKGVAQDSNKATNEPTATLDTFAPIDDTADSLPQPSLTADASTASQLFEPFTFFLSRETPRHPIEFLLKAFGCKRVGWDDSLGEPGSYCSQDDPRITHQLVDRPDLPLPSPPPTDGEDHAEDAEEDIAIRKLNERVPGRIYVQPQWVWDSINAGQLQRPDLYAPGATLPPHLSPWVKPKKGEYDPTIPLAQQETVEEAEAGDEDDAEELDDEALEGSEGEEVEGVRGDGEARAMEEELDDEDGGMDVQLASSDDEDVMDDLNVRTAPDGDDWDGFSGDELEINVDDNMSRQAQAELEAEALGRNVSTKHDASSKAKVVKQAAQSNRSRAEREAQEDIERRKMMMPRRKRKVYEKMVYSNARKDEEAEKLRAKRRKIEKTSSA